ncbi:M23 family metallopeptidase [Dysgonomonas sp. Marseille-P4677]|uniref:M23 family metallopeptidase n=1 Tax=Dysgonomonas sp. Marseille-P4677 TaxID=2364790 RepID=UPI001913698B|nr:M23 family metallopeptidase [Dysgonomonas sp. Marseille-P4677]MBK5720169.1 M23 family metallopeptidase [Dysgonomonas sp. Marseille-P4677]
MKKFFTFLFSLFTITLVAQITYRSPLDIPLILSANFGELRPNHFHSGIDFKTQGGINKPVYAIADGYISRISVSPSGYGLAIYINHANGQTSVYGHLEKFVPAITEYVKERQYEKESYPIDITLDASVFPLKKGDLFAYSGNTGSSGGPHVHFEIRNTENQIALDALEYYKDKIDDNLSPIVKGIAVYPVEGEGAVNGGSEPYRQTVGGATTAKRKGAKAIADSIFVWGKIGIGIHSIDRMTGTNNIYGVKAVRLFCNDKEIFFSDIVSVDFGNTRMINSMIDFDYWYKKKVFYMKSFIEPGNRLQFYKTIDNGYININEGKAYKLKYELTDLYGNISTYTFYVYGKKQDVSQVRECTQLMAWDRDNYYEGNMFSISIPKESLYNNLCFNLKRTLTKDYMSAIYEVGDEHIPLDKPCDITIKMTKDTLVNKAQYGIVRINGARESWIGGKYNNGAITARVRELGSAYAVAIDTKAPVITPVLPAKWVAKGEMKIRVSDNKSGISSYRGTIDGDFVLFEHDVKSPVYTYKFDSRRLKRGQNHKLIFTAADACGNESRYEYEFKY